MNSDMRKIFGSAVFNDVLKMDDKFSFELGIEEFSMFFNTEVTYLDMDSDENVNQMPSCSTVNINLENGDVAYYPQEQTLAFNGEITLIDGFQIFVRNQMHPESTVRITLSVNKQLLKRVKYMN